MTATLLPPLPEPCRTAVYATSQNTDSVRKGYEMGGYEKEPPLFDENQMQAYATQARADLEAEVQRLREALHRIDSVAVFLPTFDVLHEGGIEAVTKNIVEAISKAVAALEKQP